MKKVLAVLVVGVMCGSAVADVVQFKWTGGSAADGVAGGDLVLTFLETNSKGLISAYVVDDKIDVADLAMFVGTEYAALPAIVIPVGPAAGKWATDYMNDVSAADVQAYAVVGDIATLAVGDTFIMMSSLVMVDNLQNYDPITGDPTTVDLPQSLAPGAMATVEVIPEPATFGLMGVAALGMFLARKKARR